MDWLWPLLSGIVDVIGLVSQAISTREVNIMRKHSQILILMAALLLSACGSQPTALPSPIETKAARLEKRAQADMQVQNYPSAIESAHDALRLYAALDDRVGQLRSHINLTRLFILQSQQDKADLHLMKARDLVTETDDAAQRYQVHLLAGKLHQDLAEFKLARTAANTLLEQAVAETYLENYDEAKQLADNTTPNFEIASEVDDTAFVMLQYARFADDFGAATLALTFYKMIENTIGISDSLYVLGMIANKLGEQEQAERYLRRALEVNLAIGDKQRIAVIVKALETQ
jgi:tetratricopeptide (TPR) repeat protein